MIIVRPSGSSAPTSASTTVSLVTRPGTSLPVTGSNNAGIAFGGLVLIGVGLVLTLQGRRSGQHG